ncbi:MAG: Uncharacterized protein G01um10145_508 [Microgenomates group bacterium Gr01-1014_5]|nr:MAG: Uncharacterized protein G01um10145_508 [Microgenomates group bacterium Gr01-1014_5]
MSSTYYLKYRPQRISELDLESVRGQLQKIVSSGRMPHAFLFPGPRGAGKTSTARILAKVLNCEHLEQSYEPCNECSQCKEITRGASLDVVEIDAASNRGVDDIRSLRETVKLAPIGAKKKVYIIDEAHMLTTEAANALLKTLEEPPSHAVFILATTAPEKLLDTIRSRCTTISFYKGKEAEIIRALKKVVEGEKLEINEEALTEIARGVDGSFREAHKILEQLSFTKGAITQEAVRGLTQENFADPATLLALLAKKETKAALSEVDDLVNKGINLKTYLTGAMAVLRKSLLTKMGAIEDVVIEGLEVRDHQVLIEYLTDAARLYPTALIPQLPLEIAVVKWCVGGKEKLEVRSEKLEEEVGSGKEKKEVSEISHVSPRNEVIPTSQVTPLMSKLSPSELDNLWPQIMKLTKEKNHSVEALLRAARPTAFDGKFLQIEVFYKFHKERLEKEPYRTLVEEVAASLLGGPLRLTCVLTEGQKRAADVRNVTTPEDEELAKLAEDIFNTASGNGKIH